MADSIFEILTALPLFQGVKPDKMRRIVEFARFHFLKYLPSQPIVTAGTPVTHVMLLISGSVRSTVANSDGRFRVSQTLGPNAVIAPEFLFGRQTAYPTDVTAIDTVGVLQISKNDYLRILATDEVFMFNLLNTLCRSGQKAITGILALTSGSIQERIAFWIVALTQPTGTDIVLQCRQRDLYTLFGVQRTSFIAALGEMAQKGLITFTPNEITVLDRRGLAAMLTTDDSEE